MTSEPKAAQKIVSPDEQEHSPCGWLVAALGLILLAFAVASLGISMSNAVFGPGGTYGDSSITPSGIGGDATIDNPND